MASRAPLLAFQRRLLAWYRVHQRNLPWRSTCDPYKILVSEIMLQQTQVNRVVSKYREFLRCYPTLETLADAKTSELRRVWYPLGYNVRPLRLRRIAQRTLRDHGGRIPDSYDGLLAMDGIGRYTAGAVLSFAFKQDAPIVDTNVARLLSRYFGLRRRTPRGASQRRLWQLAGEVIPPGKGHRINQAMMDFGAMICTARSPQCPRCVLRHTCRSYPFVSKGYPPAPSSPPKARVPAGRSTRFQIPNSKQITNTKYQLTKRPV
jgi:A/G-specific adenine glycosylase